MAGRSRSPGADSGESARRRRPASARCAFEQYSRRRPPPGGWTTTSPQPARAHTEVLAPADVEELTIPATREGRSDDLAPGPVLVDLERMEAVPVPERSLRRC